MNCLPVIERELRVRSRLWSSYTVRMLIAGSAMLVVLVAAADGYMRRDEQSLVMLMGSAAIAMIMTQLSGCFFTADTVSSEKREGTLGLLFLTPLSSRDVILGKLASAVIPVFFGMLAILPVFFVPMLNGGITVALTIRVFAALTVSLFVSLSVGILLSTLGREARSTAVGTFIVMVLMNAIPLLYVFIGEVVLRARVSPWGAPQLGAWAVLFFSVDDVINRYGVSLFWTAVLAQAAIGCAAWGAAVIGFRRLAERGDFEFTVKEQEKPPGVVRRFLAWVSRPSTWKKSELGDRAPYDWLVKRGWSETWWMRWFWRLLWLGFFAMFVASLFARRHSADELLMGALWIVFALHLFTKIQLSFEVTRQLSDDRRAGCLELLLSTPLATGQILSGVRAAARKAYWFRFAKMATLNLVIALTLAGAARHYRFPRDFVEVVWLVLLGGGILAVIDYSAIRDQGMLQSLTRKTHLRAALVTFGMVVGIPWIALLTTMVIRAVMASGEAGFKTHMALWFIFCAVWDSFQRRKAERVLSGGFRKLAVGEKI